MTVHSLRVAKGTGIGIQTVGALAAVSSTEFQGSERKQGENERGNPEANYDLRLGPAEQFKMMMQGRHFENALLAQFVGADLKNHRERFEYEDPADKRQQKFLFDHHGDSSDRATEGQ